MSIRLLGLSVWLSVCRSGLYISVYVPVGHLIVCLSLSVCPSVSLFFCLVLSCLVLSCLVLSCLVLIVPRLVLIVSCLVLSPCLVLMVSCLVREGGDLRHPRNNCPTSWVFPMLYLSSTPISVYLGKVKTKTKTIVGKTIVDNTTQDTTRRGKTKTKIDQDNDRQRQ